MNWINGGVLAAVLGLALPCQAAWEEPGLKTRYEYVYLQQVQASANGHETYQVASVSFPEVGPCEEAKMVNLLRYKVVLYGKTYWIDEPHVGVRPIPGCGLPPPGVLPGGPSCE